MLYRWNKSAERRTERIKRRPRESLLGCGTGLKIKYTPPPCHCAAPSRASLFVFTPHPHVLAAHKICLSIKKMVLPTPEFCASGIHPDTHLWRLNFACVPAKTLKRIPMPKECVTRNFTSSLSCDVFGRYRIGH